MLMVTAADEVMGLDGRLVAAVESMPEPKSKVGTDDQDESLIWSSGQDVGSMRIVGPLSSTQDGHRPITLSPLILRSLAAG